MFTGIINGTGIITGILNMGHETRFHIQPQFAMGGLVDGESIAINGVCLSVEKHDGDQFQVYASKETLSRTNLTGLRLSTIVNLERAIAAGERLGGHLVSGHVDCVAIVASVRGAGQSLEVKVGFPREFAPQIIAKGSIALDGISLTINECGMDFLTVNIIPDSQKRTNIGDWKIGSRINMETDLIGKYVLRALSCSKMEIFGRKESQGLSRNFLAQNGFI